MNKPALLACLMHLTAVVAFAQKGELKATETEAVLILFVIDPDGEPVKKVDVVLSYDDKTWTGETGKEGFAKFLLPVGHTYSVQVEDSAGVGAVFVPVARNQTLRSRVNYWGAIDGKMMPAPLHPSYQASHPKPLYTQLKVRYFNFDDDPLPHEEVLVKGPSTNLRGVTDEHGEAVFTLLSGQTYEIGNTSIPYMSAMRIPAVYTGTGSSAQISFTWVGSEKLAENARFAAEYARSVTAWREMGGKSSPPWGLEELLSEFTALAEETGGKFTILAERDSLLPVMNLLLGNEVKPGADVVILMDVTGSMVDDIDMLRKGVGSLAETLKDIPDLHLGIACYGDSLADKGRWYYSSDLPTPIDSLPALLNSIQVTGGGDWRESAYDALVHTLSAFEWRKDRQHLILLLGDAPSQKGDKARYNKEDVIARCKMAGVAANLYPVIIGYF